jgi:alkylated DNA repair dioxygenase AlkB
MRYRPLDEARHDEVFALELQPRSLYVMRDDIRWLWHHNIPPVKATRYSITLRTLRDDSSGRGQIRRRRV